MIIKAQKDGKLMDRSVERSDFKSDVEYKAFCTLVIDELLSDMTNEEHLETLFGALSSRYHFNVDFEIFEVLISMFLTTAGVNRNDKASDMFTKKIRRKLN